MTNDGIDRREFLKGAAATAALMFTADTFVAAAEETAEAVAPAGPPVKIGVIGAGQWGREILTSLAKTTSAQTTAVCDTYQPYLDRAKKVAPDAATFTEYAKLLESPEVEAVVIATPTHLHKDIALAAIQAGKHVYCEAPLAHTLEDAKAIALAGKGSSKVFQVGLQGWSNELYNHVEKFVRSSALGTPCQVHGQYDRRTSWRRAAPSPEREQELNWRLSRSTSPGLLGEASIHQIDLTNRYLKALPVAVSGFGSIIEYNDGRDVPDTVQCVLEYPNNVRMLVTATLVSSFSSDYTLFQGSKCSLLMRDTRGWMVKEADAELLGWEVYAKKETCFEETGICMIAGATKILRAGKEPGEEGAPEPTKDPLVSALEDFAKSVRDGSAPACGAVEGYQAAVCAIRANEAALAGNRIELPKESYDLA